jgi:hypothetical protein
VAILKSLAEVMTTSEIERRLEKIATEMKEAGLLR